MRQAADAAQVINLACLMHESPEGQMYAPFGHFQPCHDRVVVFPRALFEGAEGGRIDLELHSGQLSAESRVEFRSDGEFHDAVLCRLCRP